MPDGIKELEEFEKLAKGNPLERFPVIRDQVFESIKQGLAKTSDIELHVGFLVVPYLDDIGALMTPEDAGIRLASRIRVLMSIDRYDQELLNKLMDTPGLHTDMTWARVPGDIEKENKNEVP